MNQLLNQRLITGAAAAALSSSERRAIVNTCFVDRVWSRRVAAHIAEMREDGREHAEATCIVLKGDRGLGKSTLLKKIRDEAGQPAYRRDGDCRQLMRPVVYVVFPPNLTLLAASKVMLAALKGLDWSEVDTGRSMQDEVDPDPTENVMNLIRGVRSHLDQRIIHELKHQRVEVVLCDEFQNVGMSNHLTESSDAIAQWVAYIMKTSNVPFVLAGTDGVEAAVSRSNAIAGLTFQEYLITPFEYGDDKTKKAFMTFLRKFDKILPFRTLSRLDTPDLAEKIHSCTRGNVRTLRHLIRYAARQAIANGAEHITEGDFYHAFERMTSFMKLELNPFSFTVEEDC